MAEKDQTPTPDPLTKDLPGLPIEFRNVRIDETGLHRKATRFRPEAHFAWEQVTAVRAGFVAVVVEGRREQSGRVRTFARSWASKAQIKRAVDTWKEYRLRVLEQRGTIRGSCDLPVQRWSYRTLVGFGLFMVFAGALSMYLWATVLDEWAPTGTGFRGAVTGQAIEIESEANLGGPSLSALLLPWRVVSGFQCIAGLGIVLMALMMLRTTRRWGRWEFSKEGFVFWPEGKRQTLGLPQKITMGIWRFTHLRVGRERNMQIQSAAVAWPLFLALNERLAEGARWRLAWDLTVAFTVSGMVWALSLWGIAAGASPGDLAIGSPMAAVLTVVLFAAPISMSRMPNRALAEGREMLKRLGW